MLLMHHDGFWFLMLISFPFAMGRKSVNVEKQTLFTIASSKGMEHTLVLVVT